MSYYPYFRGKQYELIAIRENAELLHTSNFTPIIEPVKEALNGLTRALNALTEADGKAIVIVNPKCGDHVDDPALIEVELQNHPSMIVGILLTEEDDVSQAISLFDKFPNHEIAFIHAGFTEAKPLVQQLKMQTKNCEHIFLEESSGKLYRKNFSDYNRVLLRDGFQKRKNREHPDVEFFSDLHLTYIDEGMNGFGDFLMVGDDYTESGGPAYAIAIHITFIDDEQDGAMFIRHFISDRRDTPQDPAGKFAEALQKLVDAVNAPNSKILKTKAIQEFLTLHEGGHFPGLGYVKKLSMQHHLETLAQTLSQQEG